jgi:hypothetical protein
MKYFHGSSFIVIGIGEKEVNKINLISPQNRGFGWVNLECLQDTSSINKLKIRNYGEIQNCIFIYKNV